jgi:hypothetical protein
LNAVRPSLIPNFQKKLGIRLGNWLMAEQGNALWQAPIVSD